MHCAISLLSHSMCLSVVASESSLPKLSTVQCTKLRHLTIVTLAIQNKVCNVSYVHLIFSFVLSCHITLTLVVAAVVYTAFCINNSQLQQLFKISLFVVIFYL